MTSIFRASIAASVLSAFALSAFAQASGSVTEASVEPGSVKVLRGADVLPVEPGDELLDDDVVQTGSTGTAKLAAYGCTVDLQPLQSVAVNSQFCDPVILAVDESGVLLADATVAGGGVGAALPLVALAGVGAATGLAGGGDGASSP